MHHLYDGSRGYSQEVRLIERLSTAIWSIRRDGVLRILRGLAYEEGAIEAFQKLPFELWRGENGFNDHFALLYLQMPASDFARLAREAETEPGAIKYAAIAKAFEENGETLRFISMDYVDNSGSADVHTPTLKSTSVAAELALENLNTLLQHSDHGPASAVDRIHTALHAHLIHLCTLAGESPNDGAGLDALFTLLRKHHPSPSTQADNVLRSLARALAALNTLRNDHSLAHPNEFILEEPEARLVLNAGQTILRYLDRRFSN